MTSSAAWMPVPAGLDDADVPARGFRKRTSDYVTGARRRAWLILLVAIAVGSLGTVYTLTREPIYQASARVLIEPPSALLTFEDDPKGGPGVGFFETRVQLLASRRVAERVFRQLELSDWDDLHGVADPVGELVRWIEVAPVLDSNLVEVSLEGTDPQLVAKIVNSTADEFLRYEQESLQEFDQLARQRLDAEQRALSGLVDDARTDIADFYQQHGEFLADGQDVDVARLMVLTEARDRAELRLEEAKRGVSRFDSLQEAGVPHLDPGSVEWLYHLDQQIRRFEAELSRKRAELRSAAFESDRFVRAIKDELAELRRQRDEIGGTDGDHQRLRLEMEARFAKQELEYLEELAAEQRKIVLGQQDDRARIARLQAEHDRLAELHGFVAQRQLEVEMRQGLVTPRIQVIDHAEPPHAPVRPIVPLWIAGAVAVGLGLGTLLALGLEAREQTVRSPIHVRAVIDTPILGAVPRLGGSERRWDRRRKRLTLAGDRSGSLACESFRNLRTGLLGIEREELLRTLLVCGPERDAGASLVAANLAATAARAGESVLLVDLDLRTPTVGRHFGLPKDGPGLVEVLDGRAPWQEAIVETDVPNLAVLPAGMTQDVPPDVVGTIEMHDLLSELPGRFDRVILDGPPLVGLADARVVARFVDALLVVVRLGRTAGPALAALDARVRQDGLPLVGLALNGGDENAELIVTPRPRHPELAPTPPRVLRRQPTPSAA